jgi:beta-lactamase regulating signal transducer with metallopeptidase domain
VLWLFVLLKLATPPLFEVHVPLPWGLGWAETSAAPRAPAPVPTPVSVSPAEPAAPRPPAGKPVATAANAPLRAVAPVLGVDERGNGLDWSSILLGVWLCGSAVLSLRIVAAVASGRRRLAQLSPAPLWLQHETAAVAAKLGVRMPVLLDEPRLSAPCVWSLGRPRLLLPATLLQATAAKGRAAVLAHELAHVRRGDHVVAHAELLLAVVFWWHPLFWFARARLRHWAELACDAWAMASVPDGALAYAGVLIDAVAMSDSAVPGPTVLAARPAARAAFERRLTMILNERVPCRTARGWWLPFAALGLGVFAAPVGAQRGEQGKEQVRVEVKVNGQDLRDLDVEERRAVLQRLLRETERDAERAAGDGGDGAKARSKNAKTAETAKAKTKARDSKQGEGADHGEGLRITMDLDEVTSAPQLRALLQQGLGEARAEIENDPDLRELGITDEVTNLIDAIARGEGMGDNLDGLIKAAMRGAGKLAIREIRGDEDLRRLGLTEGIEGLITGLLENEANQDMLLGFAKKAARSALREAKVDIENDQDLRELGIELDVSNLLDSLLDGSSDFDASLQNVIEKAIHGAMKKHGGGGGNRGHGDDARDDAADDDDEPAREAPKTARKAKSKGPRDAIR